MSTITKRSIRRNVATFKGVPTLAGMVGDATKHKLNYATRGRRTGARVADLVTLIGRTQVVTVRHPTKKSTRGRLASLTVFL